MPRFFRPPEGVYSIHSLEETQAQGYKNHILELCLCRLDVNKQPGKEGAYNMVMNNYHNGSIMLLHAVSQSNTEALSDIIKSLKKKGIHLCHWRTCLNKPFEIKNRLYYVLG